MDHSPLWSFAEKALEICDKFRLTSDEVGDLLDADPANLEIFYHEVLKGSSQQGQGMGFDFRKVESDSVWIIHFWKVR